jgi:outer membrane protein assembly factor BamB
MWAAFLLAILFADWPQFRGPGGQGHSAETGLPLEWNETHNIAWKVPVPGRGWSSPVVAGGKVWLTTAIDDKSSTSYRLLTFDAATGRILVDTEVLRVRNARLTNEKNSHASPTPVVEGDRVYVHFGREGTAALSTSGEILWKTTLPYESQHGNGGSPVLFEDLLIVSCDGHDQAYVVALDKATGKQRWKTSRRRPWDQAYTTPLIIRAGEQSQLISVGAYRAVAYDPRTGREIWYVSYGNGFSNVPRPVFAHGLIYITTGFFDVEVLAVRPDGRGDVTRSNIVWRLDRGAPYTPSPIVVGNELYVVSDLGVATCVDARTGRIHWQQRLNGNFSASPIFADGRIYFLSEEGVATVIAPGTSYRQLARNELNDTTYASIAVSDGALFIRGASHLYKIGPAL